MLEFGPYIPETDKDLWQRFNPPPGLRISVEARRMVLDDFVRGAGVLPLNTDDFRELLRSADSIDCCRLRVTRPLTDVSLPERTLALQVVANEHSGVTMEEITDILPHNPSKPVFWDIAYRPDLPNEVLMVNVLYAQ